VKRGPLGIFFSGSTPLSGWILRPDIAPLSADLDGFGGNGRRFLGASQAASQGVTGQGLNLAIWPAIVSLVLSDLVESR